MLNKSFNSDFSKNKYICIYVILFLYKKMFTQDIYHKILAPCKKNYDLSAKSFIIVLALSTFILRAGN